MKFDLRIWLMLLAFLPFHAFAREDEAPQFSANNKQYFAVDSTTAGPVGFVRENAAVKDFYANLGRGNARGEALCQGKQWVAKVSGLCYSAGSDKDCNCLGQCDYVRWEDKPAYMIIEESVRCSGDYCFAENMDPPGNPSYPEMGKTTTDHMFRAMAGGDGFLDFKKCGELNWIQRVGGENLDMMIPTGCNDYKMFLEKHPKDVIHIEGACRPAVFHFCPDNPPKARAPAAVCTP